MIEKASTRHRLTSGCDLPGAGRKHLHNLWVCAECGQCWRTTRQQPGNIAPTALSYWWVTYPEGEFCGNH